MAALLDRRPGRDRLVESRVARIVERVQLEGDRALMAFAQKFDRLEGPLEVAEAEIAGAEAGVPPAVRRAIRMAAANIRAVARRQLPPRWRVSPQTLAYGSNNG